MVFALTRRLARDTGAVLALFLPMCGRFVSHLPPDAIRNLFDRKTVVVSVLGLTQMLAWASTYYLTAVFADPVSASLHLSRAWFFGAVSGSLLISGLLGPLAGRVIDRFGGRDVLTATNLVFAAGRVVLATTTGAVGLVSAWIVLGIGMGFGLYEASFATAAGLYGREARSAITVITLFGGFASTVGWPVTAMLIDAIGWRGASLVWAGLHLVIGLPLNRLLIPKRAAQTVQRAADVPERSDGSWIMVVLAGVFGATWFVSVALAAHLPRLLQAMGATPAAAIAAAALVGPAQVTARVVEFGLLRRATPLFSARLAAGLHPVGAILLAGFGAPAATVFVLLHGAGNGLLTIARGTLPLTLFGAAGYGLRTGLLTAPSRILQSGAPILFGLMLDRFGPHAALLLSGTLMTLSLGALLLVSPARTTGHR